MEPASAPTAPTNAVVTAPPQERTKQIARTETGLLLLAIAVLVQPIPVVAILALILAAIGAVLLILGAPAFGRRHVTLVYLSVALFIGAEVAELSLGGALASAIGAQGGASGPAGAAAMIATFDGFLIDAILVASVLALAYVLIAFGLEDGPGRAFLLAALVADVVVSVADFVFILGPLVHNAMTEAYASTPPNAAVISGADAQLHALTAPAALGFIPLLLFAAAYFWAMHRIDRGEIPPPARPGARTSDVLLVGLVALVVVVSLGAVGGVVSGVFTSTPPPPPRWVTVATFAGNTTARTANFTITGSTSELNESIFANGPTAFGFSVYTAGSNTLAETCGLGSPDGGGPMAGGCGGPSPGAYYILVTQVTGVASWQITIVELT